MDFGIVTAKVDEIGYIAHAENLGYSHAWVTDSPMIRSNCHYSFVDPEEARFITADLIRATCLTGTPEELMERLQGPGGAGAPAGHAVPLAEPAVPRHRGLRRRVMARL